MLSQSKSLDFSIPIQNFALLFGLGRTIKHLRKLDLLIFIARQLFPLKQMK